MRIRRFRSDPYWRYSQDKIACEDLLVAAYRKEGFPATIVRPSPAAGEKAGAGRHQAAEVIPWQRAQHS